MRWYHLFRSELCRYLLSDDIHLAQGRIEDQEWPGVPQGRVHGSKEPSRVQNPHTCGGGGHLQVLEKNHSDESIEAFSELDRLVRNGFIKTTFLEPDERTFNLASKLMSIGRRDDRETVSAMDALITASSTVDPESSTLYTEDQNLLYNGRLREEIDDWRSRNGYPNMSIRSLLRSNVI